MNTIEKYVNPCAETLSGIGVFQGLSYQQRQELAPLCNFHHYPADCEIISYQADNREIYFIISGQVQAIVYSLSGKQIILNDLGPGELFGELSAIDGQPRSASIRTISKTIICSMTYGSFWFVLHHYPSVTEIILKRLSLKVRQLCQRVYEVCAMPVKNRVHMELLRLALRHEIINNRVTIDPAPTHTAIANHIATHREAVSREIAQLKINGIIDRTCNPLIISDMERLRQLVQAEILSYC
jgi:CRP-like cAMP-binding protein